MISTLKRIMHPLSKKKKFNNVCMPLPIELIRYVGNFLSKQDLQDCILVSRAWFEILHSLIWRQIRLTSLSQSDLVYNRTIDTDLILKPYASYIVQFDCMQINEAHLYDNYDACYTICKSFSTLLSNANNLKILRIGLIPCWHSQQAIQSISKLSNLNELELYLHCDSDSPNDHVDINQIFKMFHGTKYLRLRTNWRSQPFKSLHPIESNLTRTEQLDIQLHDIHLLKHLSNLTALTLTGSSSTINNPQDICIEPLTGCKSLKALKISVGREQKISNIEVMWELRWIKHLHISIQRLSDIISLQSNDNDSIVHLPLLEDITLIFNLFTHTDKESTSRFISNILRTRPFLKSVIIEGILLDVTIVFNSSKSYWICDDLERLHISLRHINTEALCYQSNNNYKDYKRDISLSVYKQLSRLKKLKSLSLYSLYLNFKKSSGVLETFLEGANTSTNNFKEKAKLSMLKSLDLDIPGHKWCKDEIYTILRCFPSIELFIISNFKINQQNDITRWVNSCPHKTKNVQLLLIN